MEKLSLHMFSCLQRIHEERYHEKTVSICFLVCRGHTRSDTMKKLSPYVSLSAEDNGTMTSGWLGAPCLRRYGRELVSKPAISLSKIGGGYRRTTRSSDGDGDGAVVAAVIMTLKMTGAVTEAVVVPVTEKRQRSGATVAITRGNDSGKGTGNRKTNGMTVTVAITAAVTNDCGNSTGNRNTIQWVSRFKSALWQAEITYALLL